MQPLVPDEDARNRLIALPGASASMFRRMAGGAKPPARLQRAAAPLPGDRHGKG